MYGQLLIRPAELQKKRRGRYALIGGVVALPSGVALKGDHLFDITGMSTFVETVDNSTPYGMSIHTRSRSVYKDDLSWSLSDLMTDLNWQVGPRTFVSLDSTRNGEFTAKANRALKIISGTAQPLHGKEIPDLLQYLRPLVETMYEFDPTKVIFQGLIQGLEARAYPGTHRSTTEGEQS